MISMGSGGPGRTRTFDQGIMSLTLLVPPSHGMPHIYRYGSSQIAHPVTSVAYTALDERPSRAMIRELKKINGSLGRARTADLVINNNGYNY